MSDVLIRQGAASTKRRAHLPARGAHNATEGAPCTFPRTRLLSRSARSFAAHRAAPRPLVWPHWPAERHSRCLVAVNCVEAASRRLLVDGSERSAQPSFAAALCRAPRAASRGTLQSDGARRRRARPPSSLGCLRARSHRGAGGVGIYDGRRGRGRPRRRFGVCSARLAHRCQWAERPPCACLWSVLEDARIRRAGRLLLPGRRPVRCPAEAERGRWSAARREEREGCALFDGFRSRKLRARKRSVTPGVHRWNPSPRARRRSSMKVG